MRQGLLHRSRVTSKPSSLFIASALLILTLLLVLTTQPVNAIAIAPTSNGVRARHRSSRVSSSRKLPKPTFSQFTDAVSGCGYPGPTQDTYDAFIVAVVSKEYRFSLDEQAMFLAQILHESDGLRAVREYDCETSGCPGQYATPGVDSPDCEYYGRGYIQLSWAANYRDFSTAYFNDASVLLDNPDRVASEPSLAWGSAVWFWISRNVHQAALTGQFGATTKIINGGIECSGGANAEAENRFQLYEKVRAAFGIISPEADESGCYN